MRMNLITKTTGPVKLSTGTVAVSLTLRPACGLPGDYVYPTDSGTLLRMLDRRTDLPASVLQRFKGDLFTQPTAKLLGVELSDNILTEIGYFVD